MILQISKWHRTENGEASNSIKVEKTTDIDCYREAEAQAYQLAANYMKDNSVIDWTVCILNPKTMTISHPMQYFTPAPAVAVEEEPAEPMTE